jgi:MerR family transcriptional regulator, heat shock protein HspR
VAVVMDWPELDHGVFAISVAAELSGLHPQTLRIYEREGLVEPGRSAGGTRLYSGGDVARLREIAALIDSGLNIAGIKRVLELEEEVRRLQSEVERLSADAELPTSHTQSGRGGRRAGRQTRAR